MKKRFIVLAIVLALFAGVGAYAWSAGYCEVAGCDCHQYYGGSASDDHCTTCGHHKAQHS